MVSRRQPAPASSRPTMTDVARLAGVSVKTVSRVVNGVESVNAEMATRVHEASQALGYEPNRLAASLRSGGRTSVVGLVLEDLANPFYSRIAAGVAQVAERHGYLLLLASSQGDLRRQSALVQELSERRVDGFVLTPVAGRDARLLAEHERGTPIVFADVGAEGVDVDLVRYDNYGATREAVRQAVAVGHRRFGLVLPRTPEPTMTARRAGVLDALRDAGLCVEPEFDATIPTSPDAARTVVAAMLDRPNPPTAVFCGNNVVATGVVEHVARPEVARRHLVSVLAFDDYPLREVLPNPSLVVSHDPQEVGIRAGERLFARVSGADVGPPVETVVATRISIHRPEA